MKFLLINLTVLMLPFSVFATSSLQENWTTTLNDTGGLDTTNWLAQTWTANSSYSLTSEKVLLRRVGTITNAVLSVRATSAGSPIGSDLVSSTVDVSGITTATAGQWVEFSFSTPLSVNSGTVYAIILRITTGDGSNYLRWLTDINYGYSGGTYLHSSDSGATWTSGNLDMNFENYGEFSRSMGSTSIATSTATLNDIEFGLGIIIVLMFLYFVGYIYNHLSIE